MQITSGNLTVEENGSSILKVTVLEVGNMYIGSATVYINGTVLGTPPPSTEVSGTAIYEPPGNIALNVQPGQ
jgi:hypothetical protein